MISFAKLATNRRNAQHSTGPKTLAGKSKVSQNARKHGLRSRNFNAAEFLDPDAFVKEATLLTADMQPSTEEEIGAVLVMAARIVQLRAVYDLDSQLYGQNPWGEHLYQQDRLLAIAGKLERDLFAAHQQFRSLQAQRKKSHQQTQV